MCQRFNMVSVWERLNRFWERYNPKSLFTNQEEEQTNEMLKNEFKKNGLKAVKKFLDKELDSWTNINLNVAVTGSSGSGKSSFINSLRHVRPSQPGAAEVGARGETTKECTPYEHPENKSFIVWDLPGVGTGFFPKKSYLEDVQYDKYDFFVIISKDRFTEDDFWLAGEVTKQKKRFFFVRSNIDTDITNNKRDYPDQDVASFLQSMKTDTKEALKKVSEANPEVFLISNIETDKYDFGSLNNEMLFSCKSLKRDALALSLSAVTREIIDDKKRVLTNRIHSVAIKITTTSNKNEQKRIFQDEITTYQKQFNIDDETLKENKDILTLTDDNLKEFRVAFDQFEYGDDAGIKMKTPTAMRDATTLWNRLADFFTWSREDKLLYGFSRSALQNNLELLYQQSNSFFDETRLAKMVCAISK
ncbi:interferon-gamma-inducible GTPase 10-like [Ruditapes philippinarum]|uniref:interferon-gamma-inducible GTPase 10-like n=1 Tax=Ruditapes philippinarum TaxID=129788 RepID=UPI00295B1E2E|nr:interferon-gamma-inducible GTPase 10-like [Ruditapes philippinarum]XP_060568776.1 interferon-gamma-inducible GTPase 10-like [Ruditapes philippinarum]